MDPRTIGRLAECIHAPVYFAPEPQQNYAALGLRGYWRGYFASRAAALGTPDAATVTRLFGGFAPRMVERAVPEVWTLAKPEDVLRAREAGATAALRRLVPADADPAPAAAAIAAVVERADYAGRPLAAAHAALPTPADPLAALWHGCTVLRELRGDAHLAALAEHDLPWPEPHVLLDVMGRLDPRQREFRGFDDEEWASAEDALRRRGLDEPDAARALSEQIEERTDELVRPALQDGEDVADLLAPFARAAAAEVPFPNAIGLPRA